MILLHNKQEFFCWENYGLPNHTFLRYWLLISHDFHSNCSESVHVDSTGHFRIRPYDGYPNIPNISNISNIHWLMFDLLLALYTIIARISQNLQCWDQSGLDGILPHMLIPKLHFGQVLFGSYFMVSLLSFLTSIPPALDGKKIALGRLILNHVYLLEKTVLFNLFYS